MKWDAVKTVSGDESVCANFDDLLEILYACTRGKWEVCDQRSVLVEMSNVRTIIFVLYAMKLKNTGSGNGEEIL